MTYQFILPLADPAAVSLAATGGKGSSLARLAAAGLPVPGGFHLTTAAYQAFVDAGGLQPGIQAALDGIDAADTVGLESASRTIFNLFEETPIPPEIAAEIAQAYAALPGDQPAVAVRSSATAEDLPDLSFAGQQDTYLNIRGVEAVTAAVRRCWSSLWTARAIGYRLRNNIDQASVRLGVVVQELIPAESAGILFTANPLDGRRDRMLINAAWGLGEAVVGGLVTPDAITVEKSTGKVVRTQIADKQVMTVRAGDATQEQPVPGHLRSAPVLGSQEAAELAQLGARIEALYGMPMDIEWARANGQFYILQARPITALPEPVAEIPAGWPLPNPKGKYGHGSITDMMPNPLTPLYATLGMRTVETETRKLYAYLTGKSDWNYDFLAVIQGYAYYNMSYPPGLLWRIIIGGISHTREMLTTGERNWREKSHPHYVQTIKRWQSRPAEDWSSAELLEGARELSAAAAYTYTTLQSGIIPTASFDEAKFTQFYNRFIKRPQDPPAPTFLLGFESAPIRAEKSLYDLACWAQSYPDLAAYLIQTPSSQIEDVLTCPEAPEEVEPETWRAWRERFNTHLEQHGTAIYNLDFARPTPAEEPAPILDTLRMYLRGEGRSPYDRLAELAAKREEATASVLARVKGWKRKWFLSLLKNAQAHVPLREDGLADLGLGYPLLRRLLLELGARLARGAAIPKPDDVFWLTEEELIQAAAVLDSGGALEDKAGVIEERKAVWRAQKRLVPPTVLPPKARFLGLDVEKLGPRTSGQEGNTIQGVAASPGRITGVARVLHGPEDFDQMKPGEILVAAITTPAWTPLFARAAAVVTDIGGPLSHGSIVAREYGIPAVLGTGVATTRITSGMQITVDGDTGKVTLQEQEQAAPVG